jgi:hypothetical protein
MAILIELTVALGLVLALLLAVESGCRLGLRRRAVAERDEQLPTVQGAILGLLALLLGFAFSGAMSRFIERQDIIVREANAIGSAYLCADLLPPVHREAVRKSVRGYLDARLRLYQNTHVSDEAVARAEDDLAGHFAAAWNSATEAARENPVLASSTLDALNEATDLLAARRAAASRHLPAPVLILLIGAALIAVATLGHGQAIHAGKSSPIVIALALLIAGSLWVIIDLDFPQLGLIQITSAPLQRAIPPGS